MHTYIRTYIHTWYISVLHVHVLYGKYRTQHLVGKRIYSAVYIACNDVIVSKVVYMIVYNINTLAYRKPLTENNDKEAVLQNLPTCTCTCTLGLVMYYP